MAPPDAKHGPGGHYSGNNPIPTIQKFMENLDSDKKARDAQIAEQSEHRAQQAGGGVLDHKDGKPVGVKGTKKTVTDPTTGREVQIEDVDAGFMNTVDDPTLSVPNANLGKETVSSPVFIWRKGGNVKLTEIDHGIQ